MPAGGYTLSAKATDNLGAVTTSSAANITVTASAASLYFIHPDHLDTPRVITNPSQQIVWRWDNSDAFGGNMANENPGGLGVFTCNLRFPGQYFDRETNNHYNYYRDYSPEIGRYVQSDPIGLRGGTNTYAYVESDPISNTDPVGLIAAPRGPTTSKRSQSSVPKSDPFAPNSSSSATQMCFACTWAYTLRIGDQAYGCVYNCFGMSPITRAPNPFGECNLTVPGPR